MAEPIAPDAGTRDEVIAILADLISRAGAERFLRAPVKPGVAAFPDPWAPTPAGVHVLLRRFAWHAELETCGVRSIAVEDRRAAKPVTERMPPTRIEAVELRDGTARFVLGYVGNDDVAGTAAHEVGALFAALHRPGKMDPYRSAEPPAIEVEAGDAERGSIATVYLGLGVLAANAAFQEYSRAGKFNGAYEPLEHDVLRAGAVSMSALAYAVAVQAVVRAHVAERSAAPPAGLRGPQGDEVRAWISALRGQGAGLCERLGIDRASAAKATASAREAVAPFDDVTAESVAHDERAAEPRVAFRWRTHRGGVGVIAGTVFGVGFALLASRGVAPWFVFGGATSGHIIGRRVRVRRCSKCAHIVPEGAGRCAHCGAVLRGDIESLSDRLEAEERLEERNELEARGTGADTDRGSTADL